MDETLAALERTLRTLDAITVDDESRADAALIRTLIETLRGGGDVAQIVTLQDPSVVHVSMLRGVIAKLGMAEWAHTHCLTARDNWQDMTLREAANAIAAGAHVGGE